MTIEETNNGIVILVITAILMAIYTTFQYKSISHTFPEKVEYEVKQVIGNKFESVNLSSDFKIMVIRVNRHIRNSRSNALYTDSERRTDLILSKKYANSVLLDSYREIEVVFIIAADHNEMFGSIDNTDKIELYHDYDMEEDYE